MLIHAFNLFARAFAAIPRSLGSSWLGLLFPLFSFLIGEGIGVWLYGWTQMVKSWKAATVVGLAALGIAYTGLFMFCAMDTVYRDHVQLNHHISDLHGKELRANREKDKAVQLVKDDLNGQISSLKTTCSRTEGANEVLLRETAAQQSSINNCQNQAIALLAPKELEITDITLEQHTINGVEQQQTILLLVNKPISPVRLNMKCDRPIENGNIQVLGAITRTASMANLLPNIIEARIDYPAWTPQTPLLLKYTLVGANDIVCKITER